MHNTMKKICFATLIGLVSTASYADTYPEGGYAAIGFSTLSYKESATVASTAYTAKTDNVGLMGTLGVNGVYKNFGLEMMVGTGLQEGNVSISGLSGYTGKLKMDSIIGVYGTLTTPENSIGSAYIKAGFARINGSGSVTNGTTTGLIDSNDDSFSYGVGFDFNLSKDSAMRLEYMNFYDKNSTTLSGVGLHYRIEM